jgi:histidyl-tRNA synthetase
MPVMQPKISGTRDYVGADAIALRKARDAIEATLGTYAYTCIDPPILERSSPFLNRSGEDIRRRMYIFSDPGGREVCLRPELTISACRTYLRQLQAPEDQARLSPEREARLCYVGPAFRYESTSEGRYRQFYQAGAELIGARLKEAADAEILAVSLAALEATGFKDTLIEIGDLGILYAFIDRLPTGERSKTRLRRLALRNRNEERFISALSAKQAADLNEPSEFGELARFLASTEPAKAELLIKEVFALADVRHVGGRTPEEIVERLASRSARQSTEAISSELMQGVIELLAIRAEPASAFDAIRDHFRKFGIGSIDSMIERCEKRLRFLDAYRQIPVALEFNVGLRRGLEYYTGFVFEIFARGHKQIGHLCGGGRYDNLLEALGANVPVPAVGFAVGLDRLLLALQKSQLPGPDKLPTPRALVVAAGTVCHEDCIRISVALRDAGWSVATETSGRRPRSALSYALSQDIAYIVFVGEDELKHGQVRIKRLNDRDDQLVALGSLDAYVKSELARESPEPAK